MSENDVIRLPEVIVFAGPNEASGFNEHALKMSIMIFDD